MLIMAYICFWICFPWTSWQTYICVCIFPEWPVLLTTVMLWVTKYVNLSPRVLLCDSTAIVAIRTRLFVWFSWMALLVHGLVVLVWWIFHCIECSDWWSSYVGDIFVGPNWTIHKLWWLLWPFGMCLTVCHWNDGQGNDGRGGYDLIARCLVV